MSSKGWEIYKLGDVLGNKGYIRGPFGSSLKRGEMKSDGIPVYEQQHAIYNSRDFRFYIDDKKFIDLRRFQVKTNDLIVSCSGTIGQVSIITEEDPKGIISQALLILRPDKTKVLPQYLKYYFLSKEGYHNLVATSHGSVQVNIASRDIVESIKLKVPDIQTQQNIINVLSALDDKIELNRQTNATLEATAQAIFDEWFVRFNFPGDDGERVESELGLIPRGWRVGPLDKIANFLNGLPLQKYPEIEGEPYLPVIKIRELKSGITDSTDKANTNVPPAYIIHDGNLIFSWSGSLEVDFWVGGDGALNQHLFKVSSENFPLWFCYLWIKNHLEEFRGIAADKTTTMGHIQRHHLSDALCLVPGNFGQIDRLINPLIGKIIENKKESGTLAKIRDLLLPKLMNGEIEVF